MSAALEDASGDIKINIQLVNYIRYTNDAVVFGGDPKDSKKAINSRISEYVELDLEVNTSKKQRL